MKDKTEYEQIFRRLLDAPLFKGGWARDPAQRKEPSVTVTAEVMLAWIEYLAQVPDPAGPSELADLHERLVSGMEFVITSIKARSNEPSDLDAFNCALALAAYLGFRAYLARIGQAPGDPDKEFLQASVKTFVAKIGQATGQLGSVWACLKGFQQVRRYLLERRDDEAALFLLDEEQCKHFPAAEDLLRNVVETELAGYARLHEGNASELLTVYRASVALDLAVTSLGFYGSQSPTLEKTALITRDRSIDFLKSRLKLNDQQAPFTLEWLQPISADRLGRGEYHVVTPAALLLSLAAVSAQSSAEERTIDDFVVSLFYVVAERVRSTPWNSRQRVHEIAHVLRALMRCQLNERDVQSVMRLMRRVEQTASEASQAIALARRETERELLTPKGGVLFGDPTSRWYLAASWHAWALVLIWFVLLFICALIGTIIGSRWLVMMSAAIGISTVCTVPAWLLYAARNNFRESPNKLALLLHFFVGGAWLVIPLAVATLLGWFRSILDVAR